MLLAIVPHDGQRATPGNGTMVALQAQDRGLVDQVHRKALELGATDEGAAGPRNGSFYGGYFRDTDGNKLVVYCMQA
jgi:predicted lactoylglutathione lyase